MESTPARNVTKPLKCSRPTRKYKLFLCQLLVEVPGKFRHLIRISPRSSRSACKKANGFSHRLDLTAASVAYIIEPQWNPMMEEQALGRIHRMGQTKEVKTIRYQMRGSFEEVRNYIRLVLWEGTKLTIAARHCDPRIEERDCCRRLCYGAAAKPY